MPLAMSTPPNNERSPKKWSKQKVRLVFSSYAEERSEEFHHLFNFIYFWSRWAMGNAERNSFLLVADSEPDPGCRKHPSPFRPEYNDRPSACCRQSIGSTTGLLLLGLACKIAKGPS